MAHLEIGFDLDDNKELAGVSYKLDTPDGLLNGVFVQGLARAIVGILRSSTPDEETFTHAIELFNAHAFNYADETSDQTPNQTEEES